MPSPACPKRTAAHSRNGSGAKSSGEMVTGVASVLTSRSLAVRHVSRIRNSATGGPIGRGSERQPRNVSSGGASTIVERTLVTNRIRQCIQKSVTQPLALSVCRRDDRRERRRADDGDEHEGRDALERPQHVLAATEPAENRGRDDRLRQVPGEHPERASKRNVHRRGNGQLGQEREQDDERPEPRGRQQKGDKEQDVRWPEHGHARQRRHHEPGVARHGRRVVRERQGRNPDEDSP